LNPLNRIRDKWFKLKFSGKGFVIDATTKDASKTTFSAPVFAQFLSTATNASGVTYSIHLWTGTDAGWSARSLHPFPKADWVAGPLPSARAGPRDRRP
jgi:hypothetical protein